MGRLRTEIIELFKSKHCLPLCGEYWKELYNRACWVIEKNNLVTTKYILEYKYKIFYNILENKIVLHKVIKHQWFQSNFRKKYVCWWKTSVQVNLSTKQVAQVQNSALKLSGQNVAPLSLGSFFRFFSLQSAQKKVNYSWTVSIMTKTVYLQ